MYDSDLTITPSPLTSSAPYSGKGQCQAPACELSFCCNSGSNGKILMTVRKILPQLHPQSAWYRATVKSVQIQYLYQHKMALTCPTQFQVIQPILCQFASSSASIAQCVPSIPPRLPSLVQTLIQVFWHFFPNSQSMHSKLVQLHLQEAQFPAWGLPGWMNLPYLQLPWTFPTLEDLVSLIAVHSQKQNLIWDEKRGFEMVWNYCLPKLDHLRGLVVEPPLHVVQVKWGLCLVEASP